MDSEVPLKKECFCCHCSFCGEAQGSISFQGIVLNIKLKATSCAGAKCFLKIFMIVAFYLHKIVKNNFELLRVKRIGWPGFESSRRQKKT